MTFDDISRYAQGLMPADERAAFAAQLQTDAALQHEFELYRELQEALRYNATDAPKVAVFAELLKGIAATEPATTPVETAVKTVIATPLSRNTNLYKWVGAAVAALLLGAILVFNFYPKGQSDAALNAQLYAQLYTQYFASDNCGNGTMSVQASKVAQAQAAVCKGDYAQATTLLQTDTSAAALFVLAQAEAAQPKHQAKALALLRQPQLADNIAAKWLQAGVLLQSNDIVACKIILQEFVAKAADHSKDAEELLEKLK